MEEAHKFFQTSFSPSDNTTSTNVNASTDRFIVEDLFDFSNDDTAITDPIFDSLPANSSAASSHLDTTTTTTTTTTTHHTSNFLADGHFSSDLSVPYDDLAELEWLSKFADESFSNEDEQDMQLTSDVKVANEESFSSENMKMQMICGMKRVSDESFSSEDVQKMQLISCVKGVNEESFSSEYVQKVQMVSSVNDTASQTCEETNLISNPQVAVPAKARSKRSRGHSGKWNSRLLVLSPTTTTSSCHSHTIVAPPKKHVPRRRDSSDGCDGRKCMHCATDKTPQWRTGPMGPKTLCNACGVRYKSGRLVPEYRPAASPTFMLTKHSNSHRKVLELRRQKEMMRAHQQQQQQQHQQVLQLQHCQSMMFDHISSNNDDYLIHQHMGPDFTHLL